MRTNHPGGERPAMHNKSLENLIHDHEKKVTILMVIVVIGILGLASAIL